MKPEAQRIAIAKACGWIRVSTGKWFSPKDQQAIDEKRYMDAVDGNVLPNYLSDLNAMHEAEKVLTPDQKTDYIRLLNAGDFGYRRLAFATAVQRAEAFLRTIGKWEETK